MTALRLKTGARCRLRARPEVAGTIMCRWKGVPFPWFVKWDCRDYEGDPDDPYTYDGPFSTDELEAIG